MPDHPQNLPTTSVPVRRTFSPAFFQVILVLGGLFAVVLTPRLLGVLGLPDYGHWFLDSYVILAANDAVTVGLNPYASLSFDILKRGHVYSDWWLQLRHLGLTRDHNFLFGGTLVMAFLAVAASALRPRSFGEAAYGAALLLSPPALLALNRANNDLAIFALIGAPLLLFRDHNPAWKILLLALALLTTTGLKFYPVVAVAALAIMDQRARRGLWLAGGTLAAALVVLWSERAGLVRGKFGLPDSVHLFGSPLLWRDFSLNAAAMLALSLGLVAAVAWWLARRQLTCGLNDPAAGPGHARWLFAIGALLLLGCFLAGTSFAYRLVFAAWLCPWLWHQARQTGPSRIARITLGLLLLSLWQDGAFCLVLNVGFMSLTPQVETLWRYLSQPVHWALMALVAGWLFEAAALTGRNLFSLPKSGSHAETVAAP